MKIFTTIRWIIILWQKGSRCEYGNHIVSDGHCILTHDNETSPSWIVQSMYYPLDVVKIFINIKMGWYVLCTRGFPFAKSVKVEKWKVKKYKWLTFPKEFTLVLFQPKYEFQQTFLCEKSMHHTKMRQEKSHSVFTWTLTTLWNEKRWEQMFNLLESFVLISRRCKLHVNTQWEFSS